MKTVERFLVRNTNAIYQSTNISTSLDDWNSNNENIRLAKRGEVFPSFGCRNAIDIYDYQFDMTLE